MDDMLKSNGFQQHTKRMEDAIGLLLTTGNDKEFVDALINLGQFHYKLGAKTMHARVSFKYYIVEFLFLPNLLKLT